MPIQRSIAGAGAGAVLLGAVALVSAGGCDAGLSKSCGGPGTICTWAGTGEPAFTGDGLAATQSALYWPMDVEFSPAGLGHILDWQNHRVRQVDGAGLLKTVVGTDEIGDGPTFGHGDETTAPGVPATTVNLNHPTDVQFAADGTLILAAWHNHKVRRVDPSTGLALVACGSTPGYAGDGGPETAALLNMPKSIALEPGTGDLYVADTRNFRVRRIAAGTGVIQTVVGTGKRGSGGDGGDPLQAQLSFQKGLDQDTGEGDNPEPGGALAFAGPGRLYIADTENQRIRLVDFVANTITTVVGTGVAGFSGDGGPATAAQLNYPRDIEVSNDGRLFIVDSDNQRIRAVDLTTGIITTVVGSGIAGDGGDGGLAKTAELHRPFGIGFDAAGDLYIADTFNNKIRRVVTP